LDGRKLWISNAKEAGLFLVFATVNPEAGHRGITCFLVERDTPGLSIGRKEDKLGIRCSSTCEVVLDGCKVSPGSVLGQLGKGYKVAMETLNGGRIAIGAQLVGLAQGAMQHALRYSKQRSQFGRPISEFQGVQFQLAEMAMKVESARLLVYNAARRREARLSFVKEAAMAKLHASLIAEEVASQSLEIFGGIGFTKECPVEKLYRDVKIGRIYEGTSNMQRLTIAREILS
jgi:alkylation response protein AidB-like acyl-CoA dehydrogenase